MIRPFADPSSLPFPAPDKRYCEVGFSAAVTQASRERKRLCGRLPNGARLTSRASLSGWRAGAWGPWRLLFLRYVPVRTPPSGLLAWGDSRCQSPHTRCPSRPRSPGAGSYCQHRLELPSRHPLVERARPELLQRPLQPSVLRQLPGYTWHHPSRLLGPLSITAPSAGQRSALRPTPLANPNRRGTEGTSAPCSHGFPPHSLDRTTPICPTSPSPPRIRWGEFEGPFSGLPVTSVFPSTQYVGFRLGGLWVPFFLPLGPSPCFTLPEILIRAASSGYSVAVGEFDGDLSTTGKKSI